MQTQLAQLAKDHLPGPLLAAGPLGVLWWQWLALLALIPLAALVGLLLGRPTRAVLKRLVARTETEIDDEVVASWRGPVSLLWAVLAARLSLPWLGLAEAPLLFVVELQRALVVVAVFWMAIRAIGVLQKDLPSRQWARSNPAIGSLIPLGARFARVLIVAIGALTVVSSFGYPIATILAGLGIGGIAIALGAQKSLEHFFGSVSIGLDQPFRIGDWIIVGNVEGEVEAIGLRSTRIRTMDRTIVTIPNGTLAEAQTENLGVRDRIRMRTVLSLEYGTPSATIRKIRDEVEALLRAHRVVWPHRVVVRFFQLGSSSLDIEVFCWIQTTVIDEFREVREELLLSIMEVVERNGASFAFPTQKLHFVGGGPPIQPL